MAKNKLRSDNMKVYNETMTAELSAYDLTKGYLRPEKRFVKHVAAIEEKGHYETLATYPNGGKDVKWVVDVKGVVEHDEYEDIKVYIPYTEKELAVRSIADLKAKLTATDYKAIKYAEGELTAYDYQPVKEERRKCRNEINHLELILKGDV